MQERNNGPMTTGLKSMLCCLHGINKSEILLSMFDLMYIDVG